MLCSRPRSSATRSRKAGSNSISPRMARSVMAETLSFSPTKSASSSIHSWPDHGRIHVGEQQLFAAVRARLNEDIDRHVAKCCADSIGRFTRSDRRRG